MKRLLFLVTRLPWPTDSGRKVSLYHYCRGLHEVYGYEIFLYVFGEGSSGELRDKPAFIREVRFAEPIGRARKCANLLASVFSGAPWQNALCMSPSNRRAVRAFAKEIRPDAILVDMVRLAPYYRAFRDFPCLKILDLDDLLSRRYARMAKEKGARGALLGAFREALPGAGNRLLAVPLLRRAVLRSESRRTARAEGKWGRRYDGVIFVSKKETGIFNRRMGEARACTVPLGVDAAYFQRTRRDPVPGTLGFLGNLTYAANQDTVFFLAREVMPRLAPGRRLYLVGDAPEEYKRRFSGREDLVFSGRVSDVREVLGKTAVFLAPVAYGSGIKTKILEAMAMGLAVVTNSVGAEGLDVTDGRELLIREGAEAIAGAAEELLSDPAKCRALGERAKRFIWENHRWEISFAAFSDLGL